MMVSRRVFLRAPVIAGIVAVVSIAIMVVSYTNLIVDWGPPQTPPGTTFNAVNDAGAEITPTEPESRIKPSSLVPTPIDRSPGRK
jgi:hypothetical protein